MPEPAPEPVIHDGAEEATPVAFKTQQPKAKKHSPLHISKTKKNRIAKAESRVSKMQTKVANSEERYKLVTTSRKAGGEESTSVELSVLTINRKPNGIELLRMAQKVKAAAPGMDVDDSDSDANEDDTEDAAKAEDVADDELAF